MSGRIIEMALLATYQRHVFKPLSYSHPRDFTTNVFRVTLFSQAQVQFWPEYLPTAFPQVNLLPLHFALQNTARQ